MNLLVANFDCQSIVRPARVVDAVMSLPRDHVEGIQVVRYDPTRAIATTLSYMGHPPTVSSQGLFFHDREVSVIVLFAFHTLAEFYHVLYHEIGHYVFLKCLKQSQRDQWMYQIRNNEKAYVTAYAQRNSREDFAESYAVYCTQPDRLNSLPARFNFLHGDIFARS